MAMPWSLSQKLSSALRTISRVSSRHSQRNLTSTSIYSKTFEPTYLDESKSTPEIYPLTNIQIKGYDFHILEKYQSYVHNLCESMGIDVADAWATPSKTFTAKTFLLGGTKVENTYDLNLYERNVQVQNMLSTDAGILFHILRRTQPEGVSISVHKNENVHYEVRHIPDPFVESLREELANIEERREEEMVTRKEKQKVKEASKRERLLASLDDDDED